MPETASRSTLASLALAVRAGGRLCAIPLRQVREIMRPQPTRALGGEPQLRLLASSGGSAVEAQFVEGIATIRGEPTPVVDLAGLLGSTGPAPVTRLVTLRLGGRQVALAVELVYGIRELDPGELVALPPLLAESRPELVEQLGRLDGELALVLDAARILPASSGDAGGGAR